MKFTENDKFAGEKIHINSPNFPNNYIKNLHFNKQSLGWLRYDEEIGMNREYPIEDNIIDELSAYIISEAKKKGYNWINSDNTNILPLKL